MSAHHRLLAFAIAAFASSPAARPSLVFLETFQGKPPATNLAGARPEVGSETYSVSGTGTFVTASMAGQIAGDLSGVAASAGFVQFGPSLSGERWLRLDFDAGQGAGVVLVPLVSSASGSKATAQPAISPAGPAVAPWAVVSASFGDAAGGTCSRASLDLAGAYPTWSAAQPYHVELHWKPVSAVQALLEARVWNGPQPPPYAEAASMTYTRTSGAWPATARSGIAGDGAAASINGIAEYDAVPDYATPIAGTSPSISYSGRWVTVNGSERHACSAGQRFRFTVSSEWLYLRVRGAGIPLVAPAIAYRIDGGPWRRTRNAASADACVPLYDGGQTRGPHAVEVMAAGIFYGDTWRTTDSRLMIRGVLVAPGGSLEPAPYPREKTLFLGDSIMCGYMALPAPVDDTASAQFDATLSMPSMLADRLGIDAVNLSVPGMGFVQRFASQTAEDFLTQSVQGTAWAPDWQPRAIVINLGTNDRSTEAYPDATLQAAVTSYLRSLRRLFPKAPILMLAPLGSPRLSTLKAGFAAAGLTSAQWIDTDGWYDAAQYHDTTDGCHPNLAGNVKYANRVAELLAALPNPAGDADGDGQITVADAAATLREAGGLSSAAAR